jgi:hypothetical protein
MAPSPLTPLMAALEVNVIDSAVVQHVPLTGTCRDYDTQIGQCDFRAVAPDQVALRILTGASALSACEPNDDVREISQPIGAIHFKSLDLPPKLWTGLSCL